MATNAVTNIPAQVSVNDTNAQWIGIMPSSTTFPLNGISSTDSRFYFKMVDFNGDTVYANAAFDSTPSYATPDISGTSAWATGAQVMPTSTAGAILKGVYTVYVLQRDNTQVVTDLFLQTFTFDYQYEQVTISIQKTVQLFNPPSISVTDVTTYLVADPQDGANVTPTIARSWNLYYPPSLQFSPVTSTSSTVQTYNVWSGNYEVALDVTLLYTFDTNQAVNFLLIADLIEFTDDNIKIPNTNLNSLYCCIKHAEARYVESKGTEAANQAFWDWTAAMDYYGLINAAIQNGTYESVLDYIDSLKAAAQCNDDCECEDDTPTALTGWGTQNIVNRFDETASGATAIYPLTAVHAAILKNKSYTGGDFQVYDGGILITNTGSGSYFTFEPSTGYGTFNYTPSAGSIITFIILK